MFSKTKLGMIKGKPLVLLKRDIQIEEEKHKIKRSRSIKKKIEHMQRKEHKVLCDAIQEQLKARNRRKERD